jgi:hypothetical protein
MEAADAAVAQVQHDAALAPDPEDDIDLVNALAGQVKQRASGSTLPQSAPDGAGGPRRRARARRERSAAVIAVLPIGGRPMAISRGFVTP